MALKVGLIELSRYCKVLLPGLSCFLTKNGPSVVSNLEVAAGNFGHRTTISELCTDKGNPTV